MSGTLEEQVEARMRQMKEKAWTTMIKKIIESLENDSLEKCAGNKLCKAKILGHLIVALTQSVNGWNQWLNFDSIDKLTEEELDDTYTKLKKLVTEFLKLDVEVTERREKEVFELRKKDLLEYVIKAQEEEAKGKKKSGQKPEFYVA